MEERVSSVNSSDSSSKNRYNETIRRQREEYQNKESELVKKHNKEIRNLTEMHEREVEKLKSENEGKLNNYRKNVSDVMTLRDNKYQKQIEDLKHMHKTQLEKLRTDQQRDADLMKKANTVDKNLKQKSYDAKLEDLKQHYNQTMLQKDGESHDYITKLRDAQEEAMSAQRKKLNDKHEKEMDFVNEQRREEVGHLEKNFSDLKKNSSQRIRNQEVKHLSDLQRQSNAHLEEHQHTVEQFGKDRDALREAYADSNQEVRDKFLEKEKENALFREAADRDLRNSVNEKYNKKINRLQTQLRETQSDASREQARKDFVARREMSLLKKQQAANLKDYERQKQDMLDSLNQKNAEDVRDIRDENSKLVTHLTKFYRGKNQTDNHIQKQALMNLSTETSARLDQVQNQADMRVENIRNSTQEELSKIRQRSEIKQDLMRTEAEQEKRDLRFQKEDEKNKALNKLKERISSAEVHHQATLDRMKNSYEKRLSDLNEKIIKEKVEMKNDEKVKISDLKRTHQKELDNLKLQYEQKLAQVNEAHNEEMARSNGMYKSQLNQVINTLKKT